MKDKLKEIKSKRLKFIRTLMYLDALLIVLSFVMLDIHHFSWQSCSGICMRILVLLVVFIVLLLTERGLNRYLRRHRSE